MFAAGNLGVEDELSMRADALVGAVAVGLVPSRPHDTIGIVSETFFYDHAFLQAMRERIAETGRPGDIFGSETSLEVNYGAALGRAITVQPYLAHIWHPDLTSDSARRAGVTHAVQIGVMLTFDVNAALDAPHIPRLRF